jgi:hypothetical protein
MVAEMATKAGPNPPVIVNDFAPDGAPLTARVVNAKAPKASPVLDSPVSSPIDVYPEGAAMAIGVGNTPSS